MDVLSQSARAIETVIDAHPQPCQSAVALRAVSKTFDDDLVETIALLDLEIEAGHFVALVGPSGCGKVAAPSPASWPQRLAEHTFPAPEAKLAEGTRESDHGSREGNRGRPSRGIS